MRCVNIDWLELYCLESLSVYPCNADYFRRLGYLVQEREFGTRQYREMFTLLDQNEEPVLEIRRNPVSATEDSRIKGMFDPCSCHMRFANRFCYRDDCVQVLLNFLYQHQYTVVRIYRLDICLDFERFDSGDDPQKFLYRYINRKYSKINQSDIAVHGKDLWDGRFWNSVSWGAPKSMVSTKLYNKTMELRERHDKPYIRYAWMAASLVDDFVNLTKVGKDGQLYKPEIWRVEFSIRSSAKAWYITEDCTGAKEKHIAMPHDLNCYDTREKLLNAFASLAHHYFHFKKFKEGQRKDRCPDKVLFHFDDSQPVYHLDRLLSARPKDRHLDVLCARLQAFRLRHPNNELCAAIDIILDYIKKLSIANSLPDQYDLDERTLLQQLIAMRIKQSPKHPLSDDIATLTHLLDLDEHLFNSSTH